jgi:hypothetical protein
MIASGASRAIAVIAMSNNLSKIDASLIHAASGSMHHRGGINSIPYLLIMLRALVMQAHNPIGWHR